MGEIGWLAALKHYAFDIALGVVVFVLGALGRVLFSKGVVMLEGKELEGKIGSIGGYSVDLDEQGNLDIMVGVKIDLLAECEKLAAKTNTKLDDAFVATLKKLMGRA